MKTRKDFRKHLNDLGKGMKHQNGIYKQRTREYGDYLYHQDRDKFEANYQEWKNA